MLADGTNALAGGVAVVLAGGIGCVGGCWRLLIGSGSPLPLTNVIVLGTSVTVGARFRCSECFTHVLPAMSQLRPPY